MLNRTPRDFFLPPETPQQPKDQDPKPHLYFLHFIGSGAWEEVPKETYAGIKERFQSLGGLTDFETKYIKGKVVRGIEDIHQIDPNDEYLLKAVREAFVNEPRT